METKKNYVVFETRGTTALLRVIRDKRTDQRRYAEASDRLCRLLAEEALASVIDDTEESPVQTPLGIKLMSGGRHTEEDLCLVDIMRSGAILQEAVRALAPHAQTAKILIQRDEDTALPQLIYSKLPPGIHEMDVILCDPMLATGGSACKAIDVLKEAGVPEEKILFANILACPEGIARLKRQCPKVRILTTAIDDCLDDRNYIHPGLGDFGDRYFGTHGYTDGKWGPKSCL